MKKKQPIMVKKINEAYNRKMQKREQPARMTAADMFKDDGVPMHVRHWLERFVRGDKYVLASSFVEQDPNTLEQAHLIFDVLRSKGLEVGERREFSEEARDYIEEYLYRLSQASGVSLWNLPEAAVAALTVLLECSSGSFADGDANFIALDAAIHRLTTREERQNFLTGDRYTTETEDERNTETGFKLSRVLANPDTPADVRREIQEHLIELCNAAGVIVDHPALARRAFLIAVEQRPKGQVRQLKRTRRALLALLDSIPEEKGGAS